jgi:hypothetical protein
MDSWEYFGAAMFLDRELRARPAQNTDLVHTRPTSHRGSSKPSNSKNRESSLKIFQTFATRIALLTALIAARGVNILE